MPSSIIHDIFFYHSWFLCDSLVGKINGALHGSKMLQTMQKTIYDSDNYTGKQF